MTKSASSLDVIRAGIRKLASMAQENQKKAAAPVSTAPAVSEADQKLINELALSLSTKIASLIPSAQASVNGNAEAFAHSHTKALSGACKVLDHLITSKAAEAPKTASSPSSLGTVAGGSSSSPKLDKQQVYSRPRC